MMPFANYRSVLAMAFLCAAAPVMSANGGKEKDASADKTRPAARKEGGEENEDAPVVKAQLPPPPEHPVFYESRGIYDLEAKSDLPYIRGDQIGVQWAECEPAEGRYDFSRIDRALEAAARKKRLVVIKVNGNNKPPYLYQKVPCNPAKWSVQIYDKQGTLMYWHDSFKSAYLSFLSAYAGYLKNAPHKEIITGLRLNYDAIGTEHYAVPEQYRPLSQWACPPGVAQGPEYTDELKDRFKEAVVDAFVKDFLPGFKIFVRANIEDFVVRKYAGLFANGTLGWFHTGASMEQNQAHHQEFRYSRFIQYCRPGYTYGFTESCGYSKFADKIKYPFVQWVYWRMLSELNCGVSFIGVFSHDLELAKKDPYIEAAFRFADTYAGYHAQPETAPGAWVALRGKGDYFPGDYTFLMKRLPGDSSREVNRAGPAGQPFGAWARTLPPKASMSFDAHDRFFAADKAAPHPVTFRVVYLDKGAGSWRLLYDAGGGAKEACAVTGGNTGQWKETSAAVSDAALANGLANKSDLIVENTGGSDVCFHIVEIRRK